jgi:hypothetical protein
MLTIELLEIYNDVRLDLDILTQLTVAHKTT